MKFTQFCAQAVVIVGFALLLIGIFSALFGMIDEGWAFVMNSLQLTALAGMMLGIGLIAQTLLREKGQ